MKTGILCAGLGVLCVVAGGAADPDFLQTKPGLYEIENSSNMALMSTPGAMKLPKAEQEKMSEEMMRHPTMKFQACVPGGSRRAMFAMMHMGTECQFSHENMSGKSYDADVTCHGVRMHISMVAKDSDTKVFTVETPKMAHVPFDMKMRYLFHRVSADCGKLKPGSVRTPDGKIIDLPKN